MLLVKRGGLFIPVTQEDFEKSRRIGQGEILDCTVRKPNDIRKHRRLFALFQAAYDLYKEEVERMGDKSPVVGKHAGREIRAMGFDSFRKLLTVKAGYHDPVFYPDGGIKLVPQSLAFENCSDELKEKIYSDVLDVSIQMVFNSEMRLRRGERPLTTDDVNDWVERFMRFSRHPT
jgi:hypothetical protein